MTGKKTRLFAALLYDSKRLRGGRESAALPCIPSAMPYPTSSTHTTNHRVVNCRQCSPTVRLSTSSSRRCA